jgi:hypothetical protein
MDYFMLGDLDCKRIKLLKISLLKARETLKVMYPDIDDMEEDSESSKLLQLLINNFNEDLNENPKQKLHISDLLNLS